MYEWTMQHDHIALFSQLTPGAELSSSQRISFICHYSTYGRLAFVNLLIDSLDKEEPSYWGWKYPGTMGNHDNWELVQIILTSNDIDAADAGNYGGLTALQAAAENGCLEVVQLLLDAKADINAPAAQDFGVTALQVASWKGYLEIAQILLNDKADTSAVSCPRYHEETALDIVMAYGHLEVVSLLKTFGAKTASDIAAAQESQSK
jgi:hypothetical protein